jgi:hypothetical protein
MHRAGGSIKTEPKKKKKYTKRKYTKKIPKKTTPRKGFDESTSLPTQKRTKTDVFQPYKPTSVVIPEEKRTTANVILSLSYTLWTVILPRCYPLFYYGPKITEYDNAKPQKYEEYEEMTAIAEACFPLARLVIRRYHALMPCMRAFKRFVHDGRQSLVSKEIRLYGVDILLHAQFKRMISKQVYHHLLDKNIVMVEFLIKKHLFCVDFEQFDIKRCFSTLVDEENTTSMRWMLSTYGGKCVESVWDIFMKACDTGCVEVSELISKEFDVYSYYGRNERHEMTEIRLNHLKSRLMKCCTYGYQKMAEMLETKFKITSQQSIKENKKAFHEACISHSLSIVRWYAETSCFRDIRGKKTFATKLLLKITKDIIYKDIEMIKFLSQTFNLTEQDISLKCYGILQNTVKKSKYEAADWICDYYKLTTIKNELFRTMLCNLAIECMVAGEHPIPLPDELNYDLIDFPCIGGQRFLWLVHKFNLREKDVTKSVNDKWKRHNLKIYKTREKLCQAIRMSE